MAKADVLRRIRQNLYGLHPVERDTYLEVTTFNSATTSITADDGGDWEVGDILESVDTGEQMYIHSKTSNTLSVIRGFNGTTAAASTSSPPFVRKNPRFTEQEIDDAFERTLASLWSHGIGAWEVGAINADPATNPQLHEELDLLPRQVVSVTIQSTDDNSHEIHVPFKVRGVGNDTQVELHWPHNTDFDQNAAIVTFVPITNIDTEDIHEDTEQILEDGATYRLLASTMAARLADPGRLSDRTVQPGQGGRDARLYQGDFILGIRRVAQAQKVEMAEKRVGSDYGTSRMRRWRV